MGKYKKYAKTEQNLDQPNKISSNNSNTNNFNQSNKTKNKKLDFNNANYIKTDESSLSEILWDIWDAMKYFFIMCKNFIIPSGISFKIFGSFIILELLYQGIIIYIINCVLSILNQYFSIWNKTANIYIYIISYIQMIYIFLCEGLLIFRFIHFKIFIFQKLNWLLNILTCIVIIINAISIKDLNGKIYRFNIRHSDISLFNNKILRDNIVNEYINLYVNKDDDFEQYELCNELKINNNIFNQYKNRNLMYNWYFDTSTNHYIACNNFSLPFKPINNNKNKQNFHFLNCQNNFDVNEAPDYCVSSKFRQKRFYSHLKIAFYQIIILILWNLYNYFSIKFIHQCYPVLKNNKSSLYRQNNFTNLKNNYDKNSNKTVTYKDINDGKDEDIYDRDSVEEEYENEEEEEKDKKKEEESKKDKNNNNIKEIKVRKINKKKWNKKKRKKNRYKEEKIKNKNIYFDEGILSKDFYEKNEGNNDESSDEDDEDYFKIKNDFNSNKEDNEKEEDDNDENDEEEEEEEENEEEEEDEDEDIYITKKDKYEEIRKLYSKKMKKNQYLQKVYNYLFGKYVKWIKNKIHHILLEIDKNLSDEDE